MKLKNKKTGEIVEKYPDRFVINSGKQIRQYDSLAELNAEWEDAPEEPKEWWYIECDGDVYSIERLVGYDLNKLKEIGNYFSSREEAEIAVEKLKAWKRLKDKGFRFDGWSSGLGKNAIYTIFWSGNDGEFDLRKDLDLLFGGEK